MPKPKAEVSAIRALVGRKGAHATHARHDIETITKPGRDAFLARFEREVDPDGTLSPEERARRATHARKAYMAGLNIKSAMARRKRSAKGQPQDAA